MAKNFITLQAKKYFNRFAAGASLQHVLVLCVCAVLSGVLHGLTWPPYNLEFINLFYLVPYILVVTTLAKRHRHAITSAFIYAFTTTVVGFYWLSYMAHSFGGVPKPIAPMVVLLYALVGQGHVVLWIGALSLAPKTSSQKHALISKVLSFLGPLIAAILYVGIECVYPKIFEDTQGAVLYQHINLIQIVKHTGVYGLTFLILWWNLSLTSLILSFLPPIKFFQSECLASIGLTRFFVLSRPVALVHLVAVVLVTLGAQYWGAGQVARIDHALQTTDRVLKVAVVQPNIGDTDKLASERGMREALQHVLSSYSEMSEQAVQKFQPELLIWPETSFPYLYTHFTNPYANARGEAHDTWIADLVVRLKTPLFFGGYHNDGTKDYNAAWLVLGPNEPAGLYLKNKLLAFGEYVPLGPLSGPVRNIFPAMGNFGRGPGPSTLVFKNFTLGPLICYETLSPSYVRQTVKQGSEILINLTNDSWFGPVGEPESHLLLSVYRAIEQRQPLLRATNTGITTLVDQAGRIVTPTKIFEPALYSTTIKVPTVEALGGHGLYHHYSWFEALTLALTALFIAEFLRKSNKGG